MVERARPRSTRRLAGLLLSASAWISLSVALAEPTQPTQPKQSKPPQALYSLRRAVSAVTSRHPLAQARSFELSAERSSYRASEGLLDPSLSLDLRGNDNLTTIADPTQQGALRGLTTKRYGAELLFTQPLRWGTQLGLGLSESFIDTDNPFNNCVPGLPSDKCYETRLSLNLTQPLLRGRSARANAASVFVAERAVNLAQLRAELELSGLIFEVAMSYNQLALTRAQLELERREEALAERQLKESTARAQAGLVAQSELSGLKFTLAQRAQSRLEAERRSAEAEEALYTLTADRLDGELALPSWIGEGPAGQALDDDLERLREHPELRIFDERLAQLEAQLEQQRDLELPELNAGLVLSQSGLGESLNESLKSLPENRSRFYGATLSFRYALSDRAALGVEELVARRAALRAERAAAQRRLEGEWRRLKSARATLELILEQALAASRASRETVAAAEGRLEAGRATQFEVSQRREAARAAELSELQARHALLSHHLSVMRLRGSLLSMFGVTLSEGALEDLR